MEKVRLRPRSGPISTIGPGSLRFASVVFAPADWLLVIEFDPDFAIPIGKSVSMDVIVSVVSRVLAYLPYTFEAGRSVTRSVGGWS